MEMWRGYVLVNSKGEWVTRLFGSPRAASEVLQGKIKNGLQEHLLIIEVMVFDEMGNEKA